VPGDNLGLFGQLIEQLHRRLHHRVDPVIFLVSLSAIFSTLRPTQPAASMGNAKMEARQTRWLWAKFHYF
jgi:hypothetical protein